MKLTEIFDRANIGEDEKARRVLNVSNAQANITADEIENGVPIERLSEIGVPVFRYATQLTIHGRLPDFDANARPSGYRAIFRNGNGSLGVRYCAIDMAKKRMVLECSKLFKAGWTAHIDSQGLSLSFFSLEKQPVVNAFTTFPRHLIYGFICAGACAMGGYMAIAEIGAIPAENLWPLCQVLFECPDRATFETRRAQKEAEDKAKREEWARECEKNQAERAVRVAELRTQAVQKITLPKLVALPRGECRFVRVMESWDGVKVLEYTVAKKAFGQLCYATRRYPANGDPVDTSKKMKRFDANKRVAIEKDLVAGYVFQAP